MRFTKATCVFIVCALIAALVVVVWAAEPVSEDGESKQIKPPPIIQKMMKIKTPPLKPGMKQHLFKPIADKQKALEDAEEKGAPDGKANTGSVHTTNWMQSHYQGSALRHVNKLEAWRPTPGTDGGIQPQGHLSFSAPYDGWNSESNIDTGCWGARVAGPNVGTLYATCSSYAATDYKRAEVFVWVEKAFTAPKTGEMTVKIQYIGLEAGLVAALPLDYNNLSRSSLYGFICYPATDTWEQDMQSLLQIPQPNVGALTDSPGKIRTLELPKVQVTQGEAVMIGAGLRQYDRSRWGGVTAGSVGGIVHKIEVDVE